MLGLAIDSRSRVCREVSSVRLIISDWWGIQDKDRRVTALSLASDGLATEEVADCIFQIYSGERLPRE